MKAPTMGRTTGFFLAVALFGAGCSAGDTDLVRVTDDQTLTRFDVPQDWNVYQLDELSSLDALPFDEVYQGLSFPAMTATGFDGAPASDVTRLNLSLAEADYPIGATLVRQVGDIERDFLSRVVLTQSVVAYRSRPGADELQKEDFSFGPGFDGVRVLFSFEGETGTDLGVGYMISVSNPDDTRIYSIIAGCNRDCFIANQEVITKVVDSWLVNKKG